MSLILYRIYEKVGKNPLRIIGTVVAGSPEDAEARARAGSWNSYFLEDQAVPETIVALG